MSDDTEALRAFARALFADDEQAETPAPVIAPDPSTGNVSPREGTTTRPPDPQASARAFARQLFGRDD